MATGENREITGSLTLEYQYQTTIYDDILTISGATISLQDPAGEIFTDKGNDTVTVSDSTIADDSISGAELMFSMGSDNDSLTISNSTLNANTFMGSGDDEVFVTGDSQSQVTINKKFSLGSGNDILTISAILAGIGDIDFGDGINTLFFDGGKLVTTGTVSPLTNLSVTSQGGILAHNLTLSGTDMAISLSGNLTGDNSSRRITVGEGNVVLNTNNNIKTNVGFDFTNSVLTQSDSGSIELVNISDYAFVADNSSITLHDIIVNGCTAAFSLVGTDLTVSNSSLSNNTCGINATDGTIVLNQIDFSNNFQSYLFCYLLHVPVNI